jgi:hypothetical protein
MRMLLLILLPFAVVGQSPVITAFPSLQVPGSSRGLAMGNTGVSVCHREPAVVLQRGEVGLPSKLSPGNLSAIRRGCVL